MSFSDEGKIGIGLGLVGLAGAGAIMVAPEQLWIGWTLICLAASGGAALLTHHFCHDLKERKGFVLILIGTSLIISGSIVGLIGAFQMDSKIAASAPLGKVSDVELRDRAVEFAARIRKFEISAQTEAYALMAGPTDPPPPANYQDEKARGEWLKALGESRQRETARGIQRLGEISTVFRNEYSYNAGILESEIKDRLEKKGRFGPYGKDSERRVLSGSFAGPTPISNFADYLERIARFLTD